MPPAWSPMQDVIFVDHPACFATRKRRNGATVRRSAARSFSIWDSVDTFATTARSGWIADLGDAAMVLDSALQAATNMKARIKVFARTLVSRVIGVSSVSVVRRERGVAPVGRRSPTLPFYGDWSQHQTSTLVATR